MIHRKFNNALFLAILFFVVILIALFFKVFDDNSTILKATISISNDRDVSLNMSVPKQCTYMAVIGFDSARDTGKSAHLRAVFGYKDIERKFPLNMDVVLTGVSNGFISEGKVRDGVVNGSIFGGEYMWFIVGYYHLNPGDYNVNIQIHDIRYDLPELDSYFLVKPFYNANCR